MTATDVEIGIELFQEIDSSGELSCERCDGPVDWTQVMKCCGATMDMCDDHRRQDIEVEKSWLAKGKYSACKRCKHVWEPLEGYTWIKR
jgi:hypothetical protein